MKLTAVTEKQANEARDKHAEMLRQAGAHAITVDEIKREGSKTFAVIALTEKRNFYSPLHCIQNKFFYIFRCEIIDPNYNLLFRIIK